MWRMEPRDFPPDVLPLSPLHDVWPGARSHSASRFSEPFTGMYCQAWPVPRPETRRTTCTDFCIAEAAKLTLFWHAAGREVFCFDSNVTMCEHINYWSIRSGPAS